MDEKTLDALFQTLKPTTLAAVWVDLQNYPDDDIALIGQRVIEEVVASCYDKNDERVFARQCSYGKC